MTKHGNDHMIEVIGSRQRIVDSGQKTKKKRASKNRSETSIFGNTLFFFFLHFPSLVCEKRSGLCLFAAHSLLVLEEEE